VASITVQDAVDRMRPSLESVGETWPFKQVGARRVRILGEMLPRLYAGYRLAADGGVTTLTAVQNSEIAPPPPPTLVVAPSVAAPAPAATPQAASSPTSSQTAPGPPGTLPPGAAASTVPPAATPAGPPPVVPAPAGRRLQQATARIDIMNSGPVEYIQLYSAMWPTFNTSGSQARAIIKRLSLIELDSKVCQLSLKVLVAPGHGMNTMTCVLCAYCTVKRKASK
jgi:hypothetical protein